jgi:hypothetical protein
MDVPTAGIRQYVTLDAFKSGGGGCPRNAIFDAF